MTKPKKIDALIIHSLARRALTQYRGAKIAGCSVFTLRRWMAGNPPRVQFLRGISRLTEVPVERLLALL